MVEESGGAQVSGPFRMSIGVELGVVGLAGMAGRCWLALLAGAGA